MIQLRSPHGRITIEGRTVSAEDALLAPILQEIADLVEETGATGDLEWLIAGRLAAATKGEIALATLDATPPGGPE